MKIQVPKLICFLLFNLFVCCLQAQFIDSLKNKAQKVSKNINNIFKGKNKSEKAATQTNNNNNSATPSSKSTNEQKSQNIKTEKNEEGDIIEISSTYKSLKGIRLPGYKNKILIGANLPTGKMGNDYDYRRAFTAYQMLLSMKGKDSLFNYLNTKKLSKFNQHPEEIQGGQQENISSMAQHNLSELASFLCTDETVGKYLCKDGVCPPNTKPMPHWGGYGSGITEFDEQEAYLAFIKDNVHTDLRNWWNKLDRTAYILKAISIPEYNFDKGGFEITLDLSDGMSSNNFVYIPSNGSEVATLNEVTNEFPKKTEAFISMNSTDAKALLQRTGGQSNRALYAVFDITFYSTKDKTIYGRYNINSQIFYLKSSKVEIFEDKELKKKLGDIIFPVPSEKDLKSIETHVAEYISIIPDSRNFITLTLPSYKNKIRFGAQAEYPKDYSHHNSAYQRLLNAKNIDSLFDNLETKKLIKDGGPAYQVQSVLLDLAFSLCNDALKLKYFCSNGSCDKKNLYKDWGGLSANGQTNEFDKIEAYQSFIKDNNHINLRNWWNKLDREAYFVQKMKLAEYDFDKGGFNFYVTPGFDELYGDSGGFSYVPKNNQNDAPVYSEKNAKNHLTFLPITQKDAKELKQRLSERKNNNVYMLFNIIFYSKGGGGYFYLKSPKVEFFEDPYLKKKIGEGIFD